LYTVGELFAGIGGIGLGFKRAGFKLTWANEIDGNACHTYERNFKGLLIINEDISKIDPSSLEHVDVLTAGFPCQAFSIAGYRKGFKDSRGLLFFEVLRYINVINPRVVFLENVKNLLSHDHGNTFKTITASLEEAGYWVHSSVLNASCYSDIPQNRERIYIVCFQDKTDYDRFRFPKKENKRKAISELIYKVAGARYYYAGTKYYEQLKEAVTNPNTVYQLRRYYIRENKSGLCPTLTANMGTGGHNVPLIKDSRGIRKLTPRECARFQGFPDSFIFPDNLPNSALYKQIGNSVSVPVIAAIAHNIKKALHNGGA
jgi:DNA (cytosine-5)-methyltransferase 1